MNLPAASPSSLTGRSKKVFITGETGFIGSHLLKQFSGPEAENDQMSGARTWVLSWRQFHGD